ncbi:MAG: MTH1187 family thiamine-binding protein [bacterium]
MPIMEITVLPLGTQTSSLSQFVADSVSVLKDEKDIKYHLTAMGTIIQSDSAEKLFEVAVKMHNAVLKNNVRVLTALKIDDRKDKKVTVESKIDSVQRSLKDRYKGKWIRRGARGDYR